MTNPERIDHLTQRVAMSTDDRKTALDFCCFLGALCVLAEQDTIDTGTLLSALDRATTRAAPAAVEASA